MKSFFLYRLPGEEHFTGGTGRVVKSLTHGFLIAPFNAGKENLYTILREEEFRIDDLMEWEAEFYNSPSLPSLHPFPESTTERDRHLESVRFLISQLGSNEKTVLSRIFVKETRIDIPSSLASLASAFPNAMTFAFYTPFSGLWLGASPELLLRKRDDTLETMALAGTRPSGGTEDWDNKNIEEQEMVSTYLRNFFNSRSLPYSYSLPYTHRAGPIEHLRTDFKISLPKHTDKETLADLIVSLSPTPALCGLPAEKSLRLIYDLEEVERGFYGGFFGEVKDDGNFDLYVLLRSLRIEPQRWCLYAGGGITSKSDPEEEWKETERKGNAIISRLIFRS